jgi:DNA replication protein DnaC
MQKQPNEPGATRTQKCASCGHEWEQTCVLSPLKTLTLWRPELCPVCEARRVEEETVRQKQSEEREAEYARREKEKRVGEMDTPEGQANLGIPTVFHGAKFSDNPPTAGVIRRFFDKPETDQWLLLFNGPCGTGKTRQFYAAVRYCYIENIPCQWHKAGKLCREIQDDAIRDNRTNIVDKLGDFNGVLLIDDFGSEKPTEYTIAQLGQIISAREEWRRRTIITSNNSLADIMQRMNDRIASRLSGGKVLVFKGDDRRLKG